MVWPFKPKGPSPPKPKPPAAPAVPKPDATAKPKDKLPKPKKNDKLKLIPPQDGTENANQDQDSPSQGTSESDSDPPSPSTEPAEVTAAAKEALLVQSLEADFEALLDKFTTGNITMITVNQTTGTDADLATSTLRSRLNENMFNIISSSKRKADSVWNRTEEKPFVSPQATGLENIDTFISQRKASHAEESDVKDVLVSGDYEEEEDEEEKEVHWKDSSAWRRGLMIILLAIGTVFLAHLACTVFCFLSTETSEHPYLCKSQQCKDMSLWLLEGIQSNAQPCDDFYQFACGKYVANNPPPDTRIYRANSEGIPFNYLTNEGLGRVLRRIKKYPLNQILPFYQACIAQDERDKVGFVGFTNLLLQLKLLVAVKSSSVDISRVIVRIYKRTNRLLLIDIYSTIQNFIVLNLRDPDREYLLTTDPVDYELAMRKAFTLLSTEFLIDDLAEIDTIVYLVMRFEAELILIQSQEKLVIFGFPDDMSRYVKIPPKLHPSYSPVLATFSFDALMTELFEQNYKDVTIFFNYIHSISAKENRLYMVYMTELLNRTPFYTIIRYFQWALIKLFALDLTWELQEIMVYIFRWVGQDPAERCFRNMFSKLHVLAATRYSKELGNPEKLDKKMTGMAAKIGSTFNNLTVNFPKDAVESFRTTFTTFSIVETSIATLEENLELFYEGLDMKMDKHFENVLQASALKAKNDFKKLQNIPPYHTWPSGDYSVDQVTMALVQQVGTVNVHRFLHIPFGALQQPFMGNDLPIFNYAGFGFWIGAYYLMHYTIHDILSVIEKYRLEDSPETYVLPEKEMEQEILPSMECILNQYHKVMEKESPEFKVDPTHQTSRVKNLAFFTAVGLITDTMERFKTSNDTEDFPKWQVLPGLEKYSADQLLFLSIARHTCKSLSNHTKEIMQQTGVTDASYQINAAYRNSKAFAKAWKCSPRRFMNPKKKCDFFKDKNQTTDPGTSAHHA